MDKSNIIRDLIIFYVTENYKKYINDNNLKKIEENNIPTVIDSLYSEKKSDIKKFIKMSLKKIQKDEYIGDLVVNNICMEVFSDDIVCKQRLIEEIKLFQNSLD
jgi:uncharacterized membrane-anchored protein YjiN (DUF445 family)